MYFILPINTIYPNKKNTTINTTTLIKFQFLVLYYIFKLLVFLWFKDFSIMINSCILQKKQLLFCFVLCWMCFLSKKHPFTSIKTFSNLFFTNNFFLISLFIIIIWLDNFIVVYVLHANIWCVLTIHSNFTT